MGIKGLFKVISDNAPGAVKVTDWKALSGRKVAIDASMSLYQFLVAVRQMDGNQLTGEDGKETSHLIGMFYRTIRIVENGLKPVYVFDGKPPDLKGDELNKRLEARQKAEKQAEESGTAADAARFERRTVHATREHNEEAKRLLRLMGIPVVEAPGEAEATCATLVRNGKAWASGSEDMDTLTFGSLVLLRHLTAGDQKKNPITEIDLPRALEGLQLSQDEFIDLCILLGCDYATPIRGMGPQTALKLIKEHRSIDEIQRVLAKQGGKLQIPEDYPVETIRNLFKHPDAESGENLSIKWNPPDVDGLVDFLVKEKGFSEDRVRQNATKLQKAAGQKPQGRLTDFFKASAGPKKAQEPKGKASGKVTKGKKAKK